MNSEPDEDEDKERRRGRRFLTYWFVGWMIAFPICGYVLGGKGYAVAYLLLGFFVFVGMLQLFD